MSSQCIDKETIRILAVGKCRQLVTSICGYNDSILDGRHHPCPECGGTDRFRVFPDFNDTGGSICNQCHSEKNGDIFATVQWCRDCDFPEAVRIVASELGASRNGKTATLDVMEKVAQVKRMPIESMRAYGAEPAKRGKLDVVRFPVWNAFGEIHSHFDLPPTSGKGWFPKGKGSSGLVFPGRIPKSGEPWLLVEGVKDACALHALGFNVCGLPTDHMAAKYARLFRGCEVTVIPDRMPDAERKAVTTVKRLFNKAASVRIATLPLAMAESNDEPNDVRDVLKQGGGEERLRQALEDAAIWSPESTNHVITNAIAEETIDDGGKSRKTFVPISVAEIIDQVVTATGGWPRRVSNTLFVDDETHGLRLFDRNPTSRVFGYLRSRAKVEWRSGPAFVTREEIVAELERTAQRYDAIEVLPHEPLVGSIYYRYRQPEPGNGDSLRKFLDLFRPETTIDRDLILAALMTLFWGGPAGSRPAFVFTSDHGRGVGKTKCATLLSHLAGGHLDVSAGEKIEVLKQRLLSPVGSMKRVVLLDNVKTMRLSWAELEALITSPTISGKQMFVGEGNRPNLLNWFITLNGVSLATDMAQRCVIIKLVRGDNSPDWYENALKFIDEFREQIIGDVISVMRSETAKLATHSRWASWEQQVLARLPEPEEAQATIVERQGEANCEIDEAELFEEYVKDQLAMLNYGTETDKVRIPVAIVTRWYVRANADKKSSVIAVSRKLRQMSSEGQLKHLAPAPGRTHGRCFIWNGSKSERIDDRIHNDIQDRITKLTNAADTQKKDV